MKKLYPAPARVAMPRTCIRCPSYSGEWLAFVFHAVRDHDVFTSEEPPLEQMQSLPDIGSSLTALE